MTSLDLVIAAHATNLKPTDEAIAEALEIHKALWAVVAQAKVALADFDRSTMYNGDSVPFWHLKQRVRELESMDPERVVEDEEFQEPVTP
jgi:hypothetical protein